MTTTPVRYREPPGLSPGRPVAASRHRKPAPVVPLWRSKRARIAAGAVVALALLVVGWPAASRWMAKQPDLAWVNQADALGLQLAGPLGLQVKEQPEVISSGIAVVPGYFNPLRSVSGLVPERIDMGVDFSGSGPVYALGNAIVTNASGASGGWPGGGWITYQLTDGPDAGLMVYVAEDITPAVQVGQRVSSSTVVGNMFQGGDGIEMGWAQPTGASAESELPEAGGIGGAGPFPTRVGASFDALLQSLGVPAAPNSGDLDYGLLPASYPANGG